MNTPTPNAVGLPPRPGHHIPQAGARGNQPTGHHPPQEEGAAAPPSSERDGAVMPPLIGMAQSDHLHVTPREKRSNSFKTNVALSTSAPASPNRIALATTIMKPSPPRPEARAPCPKPGRGRPFEASQPQPPHDPPPRRVHSHYGGAGGKTENPACKRRHLASTLSPVTGASRLAERARHSTNKS
jgi:hypothetical protein